MIIDEFINDTPSYEIIIICKFYVHAQMEKYGFLPVTALQYVSLGNEKFILSGTNRPDNIIQLR